jgi:hypothetical protein
MSNWQSMGNAPTDKPILLNVGYPRAVIGQWNEAEQAWTYANLQAQKMETGDVDCWWENEIDKKPLAWHELPEV